MLYLGSPFFARYDGDMANVKSETAIGLVGDCSTEVKAHAAIPSALALAANVIGCDVETRWLPTPGLERGVEQQLAGVDAIWCVPGSPYASMEGALNAVRFARERSFPFLATCGGFQHAVIEYARNVLGFRDADHPFFIATLFQPELSALSGVAHPLVVAFVRAAARKKKLLASELG